MTDQGFCVCRPLAGEATPFELLIRAFEREVFVAPSGWGVATDPKVDALPGPAVCVCVQAGVAAPVSVGLGAGQGRHGGDVTAGRLAARRAILRQRPRPAKS